MKEMTMNDLLALHNKDGLTLVGGQPVSYHYGWQVATEGIATKDPKLAMQAVADYNGNCGIWLSDGIYYVDKSSLFLSLNDALAIGRAHNQISIYEWHTDSLIYC